jgi:hypothetical protein
VDKKTFGQGLVFAGLFTLSFALAGCGRKPVGPEHGLTQAQAQEAAQEFGRQYTGTTPLEFTRALLLPIGIGNVKSNRARPARAGSVTAADQTFTYEIQAYDANGTLVPWDSTDPSLFARVDVSWRLRWDYTDASGPSFFRWHDAGRYSVTGFRAADAEWGVSGAASDSLQFRFVDATDDVSGDSRWAVGEQAVRWSKSADATVYPLGGTESILGDVLVQGNESGQRVDESFHADAVLTYNGTVWAGLLIDGKYRFELNLDTGEVRAPA